MGTAPAPVGVEVGEVPVLPSPRSLDGCLFSSEVALALRFKMHGLETISTTRRNRRGPDSSHISPWIFVCTRRSLRTVTQSHTTSVC